MENITVRGEHIVTFTTFEDWVNRGKTLAAFTKRYVVLCVDAQGHVAHIGEDFEHARDNDMFPIKAYRLARSTEF